MPVFRGDIVAQGVGVPVLCHLRVSGGTGGKEHKGRVIAAGSVFRTAVAARKERILRVHVMPAFPLSVDHDQGLDGGAPGGGALRDLGGVAVRGADERLHAGGVEAVFEIMLLELVGGGDGDGAELVQGDHGEPELIVALEHQHDPVSPFDAQGGGPAGCPGR